MRLLVRIMGQIAKDQQVATDLRFSGRLTRLVPPGGAQAVIGYSR